MTRQDRHAADHRPDVPARTGTARRTGAGAARRTRTVRRAALPALPALAAGLALGFLATFAPPAAAQTPVGEPVWRPLSAGVPEDTPAEVLLDPSNSDEQQTAVQVVIHGFWEQDVQSPGGQVYQRITVPGLPKNGQVGAPELPVARFGIAVPTDAVEVRLLGIDQTGSFLFPDRRLFPTPIPAEDEDVDPTGDPGPGDTTGSGEVFMIDDAIYGTNGAWPSGDDLGPAPVSKLFGHVPAGAPQVHPASFNPVTGDLVVHANTLYVFTHGGPVGGFAQASPKKLALAKALTINWPEVTFHFPPLAKEYHSRYLIVTRDSYVGALAGFEQHKKTLGYDTEIRVPATLDVLGFAQTIEDWYLEGSGEKDHFVLIVGDTNTAPVFQHPFFGETDDIYASIDGDFFKEVHLGRLSVDGTGDLANQVQKIIDYEINPVPFGDYDEVLLVAHDEGAPYKYTLAHSIVANASYATPPVFNQQFGYLGATNANVSAAINADVGLVAYRGHGSTNTWYDWNPMAENYHKNQVLALNNMAGIKPIVWSFSCTNSNIAAGSGTADCIGEAWLEASGIGGVAHYGATDTTGTEFNHILDRRLFETVYDDGLTTHGMAIDATELMMYMAGWTGKNLWRYMLLGDPSMTIRRLPPQPIILDLPAGLISSDDDGTVDLLFQAQTASGAGLSGALVSLYKPSLIPGEADEVLATAWADDVGLARFTVNLATPGELHYAAQDGEGNVGLGVVDVAMSPAWEVVPGGAAGVNGPPKLHGMGPLQAGQPMQLVVTDARENAPAWLVLGFSAINAPFQGGLMVPSVDLVISGLDTSDDGHFVIGAPWPAGIPSGFPIWFQCWIQEPVGPQGYAGTNGLKGTTP